jgi:hypothetical protein
MADHVMVEMKCPNAERFCSEDSEFTDARWPIVQFVCWDMVHLWTYFLYDVYIASPSHTQFCRDGVNSTLAIHVGAYH